jgi:hypothetical protein
VSGWSNRGLDGTGEEKQLNKPTKQGVSFMQDKPNTPPNSPNHVIHKNKIKQPIKYSDFDVISCNLENIHLFYNLFYVIFS